jgi:hypothetical protein
MSESDEDVIGISADVLRGYGHDAVADALIALADQGKPQITEEHRPQRLSAKLRADLIDFAKDRIQTVWNDVGETDAETLAENVVSAQEFAWMSAQVPIVTEQMVEDGARALAYRLADLDWPGTTVVSAPIRFEHRSGARAVLEAALGKGGE